MANEAEESPNTNPNPALINSFCEITSSSQQEALFYLESHNYDLDAAVLTFFDSNQSSNLLPNPSANPHPTTNPNLNPSSPDSPSQSESLSHSQSYSPSRSNSRSRSVSPPTRRSRAPYELRSRRADGKKPDKGSGSGSRTRGIRTLADLNRSASDDSGGDSDEPQEYYTGGEKSGMLVQDPTKGNDVESIFDQAKRSGAVERPPDKAPSSSKSKSFTGKARLLSGESVSAAPQPPETVTHTITFWQNGFTVDDGPLRSLDDPQNASFLESIKNSSCPEELEPADRTAVHIDLVRRDEAYMEPKKPQVAFKGTGRTLGSTGSAAASEPAAAAAAATSSLTSQPLGLVVDDSLPTTSIQLRLADGTRMVSRFNYNHTIRDIRGFIDAARPGGARNYLLQTMGFPPKQLSDADQTIEQAGIANSVVIQKY